MPEPPPQPPTAADVHASLHHLAQFLRQSGHLDTQEQQALADLVDELGRAIDQAALPSAETAHLAESIAQLTRAVHHRHDTGLLTAAKERLGQAVVSIETQAPMATGLVRRLLEALANLGI
jgi:tRNA C32,U32 (ribose-2'-O)-methylase TrmJ